jgi:hypothetical protein
MEPQDMYNSSVDWSDIPFSPGEAYAKPPTRFLNMSDPNLPAFKAVKVQEA